MPIAILDATLPSLIQREHIWYQAEAYLTLSKAHLKLDATKGEVNAASKITQTRTTGRKRFEDALYWLNRSMHLFEECHDRHRLREVCFLKAQIYSSLSNEKNRDAMSEKFIKLGNARRCNMFNPGEKYSACGSSLLDALSDPLTIQVLVRRTIY